MNEISNTHSGFYLHDGFYTGKKSSFSKLDKKKFKVYRYCDLESSLVSLDMDYVYDMQYIFRKNALEYGRGNGSISEEQFNLRKVKLEESNAARLYHKGFIDELEYQNIIETIKKEYASDIKVVK